MKKTSNYYGTYMRVLQEMPKKTSGYYGNYMRVLQKMLKNPTNTMDPYVRVLQRMKNVNNYLWPICGYYKRCQKYQRLLWDLYVGIAMNAKCLRLF